MGLKNTAPDLDGVPGRAWVLAMKEMETRVLDVLTRCLVQGQVPRRWKTGKLVLLRKDGRPIYQPSAYRPIVLLDEVCKLLERIVAERIKQHLDRVGPNLSNNQYGFRAGRSTIGAIAHLRDVIQEETARGGVVLAVSLDISNAFNSLPWETINEALKYHGVPKYIRRVIRNYLSDRSVQYPTREGVEQQEVECGVPQGSALGPDLWNIGYDWVLRGAPLSGVDKVCYADDTLAVVRGRTHREALIRGTAAVALLVHRIRALGLRVALEKSEAIIFHGPRNSPPPGAHIVVGGSQICVKTTMTYLGLVLDSRWTFKSHFIRLSERVSKTAGALARLLPNLGGPSLTCRRLYLGVIQSMVMYGAPIWTKNLSTENRQVLGRLQRVMAIRAIRGYRTVSRDAACALAGSIPWDIEAESLASVYWCCQTERRELNSNNPPPDIIQGWRNSANERALDVWVERLEEPRASVNLLTAIRPVIREWKERRKGVLTFRLTQVLTGHGCFGKYLCDIARAEESTACHHCDDYRDTAEHTLLTCPAWNEQRAALQAVIGVDISLPAIFPAMLSSEDNWRAVAAFAENVMLAKEEAGRRRERVALDPPRRQRRRPRARNGHDIPP